MADLSENTVVLIHRSGSDVIDDHIETPKVHSFVSFNFSEKKGAYMTTYVAPFVRFP